MNYSRLSLKKINNIERQIKLHQHKTVDKIDDGDISKYLIYKSGERSKKLRNFYEYYIDGQSLINIISKNYWNTEANENSEFFNSHIGCLGGFGQFWDEISISILTKKEFTREQTKKLVDLFAPNYKSISTDRSNQKQQNKIVNEVRDNFLMYCCQDCGDSNCGGLTLSIKKENNMFICCLLYTSPSPRDRG